MMGGGGGFGVGRVVIDRPTLAFRMPYAIEEGLYWTNDSLRKLGRRAKSSVVGLFNGNGGGIEYFLDENVDIAAMGVCGTLGGSGDGTIYRTLKGSGREDDGIRLEGNVNVTPMDGFRQDVSQLDPARVRREEARQYRRRAPKAGRSLRPRYGHLYR
mmetsp:Transcript_13278/g.32268  ORF Transcript_13278/g.32268 Transcript_13278/m.32268 type:complete len:157 (-) Transcript_13278:292-762(-)